MSILLIEDDEDQRALMGELLSMHGLARDSASSIVEAKRLLTNNDYQVVVTDYDLGDGFATELFNAGLLDPARTVVVTGHSRPDLPAGVEVMHKPVSFERFIEWLAAQLERSVEPHGTTMTPPATTAGPPATTAAPPATTAAPPATTAAPPATTAAPPATTAAPPATTAAPPATTVREVALPAVRVALYYAGGTPNGVAARRNLAEILAEISEVTVEVDYIDLAVSPERLDPEDDIVFTPTLVRRAPAPRVWIIGDLSERDVVRALFEPEPPSPRAPEPA